MCFNFRNMISFKKNRVRLYKESRKRVGKRTNSWGSGEDVSRCSEENPQNWLLFKSIPVDLWLMQSTSNWFSWIENRDQCLVWANIYTLGNLLIIQFRTHGDWLLKVLNLLTGNFNLAGLAHMLTIWISWLHFSLTSAFCIVLFWQQLQQELQENPGSHPFDEVRFFVSFLIILNRWPMHYCRVQREREGVSYLSIYVLLMHFGITVMELYNEWSPTRMRMKPNESSRHY